MSGVSLFTSPCSCAAQMSLASQIKCAKLISLHPFRACFLKTSNSLFTRPFSWLPTAASIVFILAVAYRLPTLPASRTKMLRLVVVKEGPV